MKNPAKLFEKFANKTVLVVGDVMMDRYIWGNVSRISPEAPVPVVEVERESLMLGGAANVASNIASLGGSAILCGVIGDDASGRLFEEQLSGGGISAEGIFRDEARPTTVKTRVVAHSQHVVRFDHEVKAKLDGKVRNKLFRFLDDALSGVDAVVVSDYAKGLVSRSLMKHLVDNGRGLFIAVDPKVGNMDYYRNVSIITPNKMEASAAARMEINDESSLVAAADYFFEKLDLPAVLITRGGQGMSLVKREGGILHIPALAREVYDVTGAGDTVIAVLGLCRAAGAGLEDAARIANAAAGLVVGEVGTSVVRKRQLLASLKDGGME